MIPAIILAAGASTRLGSPKQLIRLHGETLLDRAVRTAREAGCHPIHLILGANAALIERTCKLEGVRVHLNEQWQEGMASSIRLGIRAAGNAEAAYILTCDQPALTPTHLQALAATGKLTASHYVDRNGVPAFFPASTFSTLLALTGDKGARDLLFNAPFLPLKGGELDIDTPDDVSGLEAASGCDVSFQMFRPGT